MTANTVAPWTESPAEDGVIEAIDGEERIPICVVGDPNEAMRDRDRANMHLIIAAPDLLAALDAAETMLMCLPDTSTNANGTRPDMTTRAALRIVRAALAKARP